MVVALTSAFALIFALPADWDFASLGALRLIIQPMVFGMVAAGLAAPIADAVPLRKASRLFPNNPPFSSIYRWATKGVRGVKLTTMIIGGRLHCTREDVATFLLALNAPRPVRGPSDSERAAADARRDAAFERQAEAETEAALATF